jgi:GPH family glycoside/pentoside/hexuronide:cation symporter
VAGISAATAGAALLAVKVWDAIWDMVVGRMVDRTRTRLGQCRPYLFAGAFLFPLMMAWTFSTPALGGSARLAYAIAAYVGLQMCFSIIVIPFQSLPVLQTDHAADRAHLSASQALWTFVTVMLVNGATMALVGQLGGSDPARGFLLTMSLWGVIGGVGLLAAALSARERIAPHAAARNAFWPGLRLLAGHRSWQSLFTVKLLFTIGLSLQLGMAIYYATAVLRAPQHVGVVMVSGALGLVAGVPLSMFLLRWFCPRRVAAGAFAGAGLASLGFLALGEPSLPPVLVLNALVGLMLGTSLPAFGPAIPNMIDHVELDTRRRLMGVGIATLNFAEKVGGGVAAALIGAMLGAVGYSGGAAQQGAAVASGIAWSFAVGPALFFLTAAWAFGWWFPLDREAVNQIRSGLRQAREAGAEASA